MKQLVNGLIALHRKDRQLRGKVGRMLHAIRSPQGGEDYVRMVELASELRHALDLIMGTVMDSGGSGGILGMRRRCGSEIAENMPSQIHG